MERSLLTADSDNWEPKSSNSYWQNKFTTASAGDAPYSTTAIPQFTDLTFSRTGGGISAGNLKLYVNTADNANGYFSIGASSFSISIPDVTANSKIEVSFSSNGNNNRKVQFTNAKSENDATEFTSNSTTPMTVTVYATETGAVKITIPSSTTFIYSIKVTPPSTKPAKPTFDPAAGAVLAGTTVTISAEDETTIYYTTDGEDPTDESTEYSSPITIDVAKTIKAIAVKDGKTSDVATAAYTIRDLAAPTFSVTAGIVEAGTEVELASADDGDIYYTLDGTDPDDGCTAYTSAIEINAPTTIKAVVYVGAAHSTIASATYTIGESMSSYYTYGSSSTSPSGASFAVPTGGSDNNTSVAMTYYTNSETWTDNKDATPAYFQGNGNPSLTSNIPTGGAYIKLVPSENGTIVVTGYSGGAKTYYAYDEDGNQKATGSTGASGLYDIEFSATKDVTYYVYVSGSKIMFHELKFTSLMEIVEGTITDAGWNTFSSNSALDLATISGGTAYIATEVAGVNVKLEVATDKVPSGTGLMIKGTAGDTFKIGKIDETPATLSGNLLVGLPNGGTVTANANNYVFGWADAADPGFYFVNATEPELGAGKAYLHAEGVSGARLSFSFDEGETTGVGEELRMKGEGFAAAPVYNLAGQRVAQPTKGLYIVNSKKVVVK